ncbi:MAG: protein-tyrosine phosphatase family protein [Solirubrobacteraceae bacterium]
MSSWFRTYGFAEILPEFLIGAYPLDPEDVAMLEWLGIKRILNLCEDREYGPGRREAVEGALAEAGIEESRIRLEDFGGLPATYLDEAVYEVSSWLDEGARTYVHCRAGWQRSATVAAAVVSARQGLDPDAALEFVQRAKPTADPLPHQRDDLHQWYAKRAPDGAETAELEPLADVSPQPADDAP